MISLVRSLTIAALCLAPLVGYAAPDAPKLTGRVVDNANILSAGARNRIDELSRAHEARTTNQIAVLTVASLEGTSIEEFANRVYSTWKLGTKDADNGVLLVVAPNERRVRIEVGYGLEGDLPDAIASQIIRNTMTPEFKTNSYDRGLDAGVNEIVRVLEGGVPAAVATIAPSASVGSHSTSSLSIAVRMGIFLALLMTMSLFTAAAVYVPGPVGWFIGAFVSLFLLIFPVALFGRLGGGLIFLAYLILFPIVKLRYGGLNNRMKKNTGGNVLMDSWTDSSSSGWSSSDSSSCSSSDFSGGGGDSGGGGASGSW